MDGDQDVCRYCQAPLTAIGGRTTKPGQSFLLLAVLKFYLVLLVSGVIQGVLFFLDAPRATGQWLPIGTIELFDSAVVIAALALLGGKIPALTGSRLRSGIGIVGSWLGLMVLLGINVLFHSLLRSQFGLIEFDDSLESSPLNSVEVLVFVCLQPAVIEELFFRFLVLDTLRVYLSRHAAVWLSGVMFGIAHIGVPLSIPYLVLAGVFFGYTRVLTGWLWLPIVLHFVHNLVVTVIEAML